MNISILGFGRIGRDLLRQTLNNDLINIVSISDIADKENLLYLLKYDTIYGKLDADIETSDTGFKINGKNIIIQFPTKLPVPKVPITRPILVSPIALNSVVSGVLPK